MPALRSLIMVILGLSISAFCWSASNISSSIQDIQSRLDKTSQLYQQHQPNDARREIQMAYFEVFENLEGPIRINVSAQKSYQMEAAFGEIRRMIGDGKPLAAVQEKIDGLKGALSSVEPALTGGHRLVAEKQHGTYDNNEIAIYWQQQVKIIDDLLAQAISDYQAARFSAASKAIQQAHYQGFKNSEMEMSVRKNRSAQQAADINQQFSALIALSARPGKMNDIAWRTTTLLQDIEDLLPALPTTRDNQPVSPSAENVTAPVDDVKADWASIADDINTRIHQAIAQYRSGQTSDAIMAVQDTYFDHFEASGMENKIGSRDTAFKSTLEGHFTRMVSLMKSAQPIEQLDAQASALRQDLAHAVTLLASGGETQWSLLLYSLMIIVREGLEALLIVVAIVAYLVKNNQHDKLALIRQSVWVALVCSVITAGLFQWLFTHSGAGREQLEGITMLIAVVMLFCMSYWLLSRAEARHWQAWLEGKLSHSLSSGSMTSLWLISFLAVYREGAETVLFYAALAGDANSVSDHFAVLAGFVIGCLILLIAWLLMRYTVVKLPLKPFFMCTGCFMYLMAFVFACKGVLELIEGKLFQPTLLPGIPEISWLGIYPYVETLLPQCILLILALFSLWFMRYVRRPICT